jgi:predicted metalloprotease
LRVAGETVRSIVVCPMEDRMRWVGRRQSGNIEDRRRVGGGTVAAGGGIGAVIIALIVLFLGGDPGTILNPGQNSYIPGSAASTTIAAQNDEMSQFVRVVLADTEDLWTQEFQAMGRTYQPPTLVLFSGTVQTGAGVATSATGPFYSPADKEVFIDLSFYDELTTRFGASGDFAQAYVIAHEVGHAVQDQLGILARVDAQQQRVSETEANDLSVRLELQADFYAGMWAHYTQGLPDVVQPGDIDEALNAASAIGDDRIQMRSQGYVTPDSFTHGTSEQRSRWFKLGYETGDINRGDTFSADPL